jgi:hypothetical protein
MSPFWFSAGSGAPIPLGTGICLFGAGSNGTGFKSVELYDCNTNIVSTTTSLQTVSSYAVSAGTYTFGFWSSYASTSNNAVDIFTYSNQSVAPGTVLNTAYVQDNTAVGNANLALVAGDGKATSVYTYSTSTVAAGTNLGTTRYDPAGCGIATYGIVAAGAGFANSPIYATTDVYTYASNTVAAGTSLAHSRYGLMATGSTTMALFSGGNTTNTSSGESSVSDIYTYASNTITSGAALKTAVMWAGASGNGSTGVFAAGEISGSTMVASTSIYDFPSNTMVSGTAMKTAKRMLAGNCTTPGGF